MNSKRLASIAFSWDTFGNISHTLNSFIPTNDYKNQDALALSVPLVIASQLGILNTRSAIELCGNCLAFLAKLPCSIMVIPPLLRHVQVELHQKDKTIVETFHPEISRGTDETKEYEDAILRFHNNYVIYVDGYVVDELSEYMKHSLLMSIYFYLGRVLPKMIELPTFSLDNFTRDVQYTMLNFCETIYPNWGGLLPKTGFKETLEDAQKQYQEIRSRYLQIDSFSITSNTNTSEMKKCPYCAEFIKAEAIVCRYCGRDLPEFKPPKRTSLLKKAHQSRQSSHIPQPDPERISKLLDELGKPEAYRRKEALQELSNIEFPPQNSQEALVIQHIEKLASSDPNPDVKTAAALALLALRGQSKPAK